MYKYVNDVSNISHNIIKNFCGSFNNALDATLGNGHDTDFLSQFFNTVYSFDIQKRCIDKYALKNIQNVHLINESHDKIENYNIESIDCAMYNLGFLPGGDKSITTNHVTSLTSIKKALAILSDNGIITIAIYTGHKEGLFEKESIINYVKTLPKNQFAVMHHIFLNRENNPPELIVIEKNEGK